jgi:hypothetical protein
MRYLPMVTHLATGMAVLGGLSKNESRAICMATRETTARVLESIAPAREKTVVEIQFHILGDRMEVSIIHEGRSTTLEESLAAPEFTDRVKTVDRIDYVTADGNRKLIRLTKRVKRRGRSGE